MSLSFKERTILNGVLEHVSLVLDTLDCRDANGRRTHRDRRQENVVSMGNLRIAKRDLGRVLRGED